MCQLQICMQNIYNAPFIHVDVRDMLFQMIIYLSQKKKRQKDSAKTKRPGYWGQFREKINNQMTLGRSPYFFSSFFFNYRKTKIRTILARERARKKNPKSRQMWHENIINCQTLWKWTFERRNVHRVWRESMIHNLLSGSMGLSRASKVHVQRWR